MNSETLEYQAKIRELEKENALLKQQQIEISKAKELYLKIFEDFPALIWRSGLNKLCDYFNKTWLEFTGRSMEEEYGNGWAEGVHPDDFDFCVQTYIEHFDKREPFLMVYRLKDKYGEYRWIRDFGQPFYDLDNTFLGYIGSCYDITEIKENERKLIESNQAKDKLFSIIAHDLRNPFNSIIGNAELLSEQDECLSSEKRIHIARRLYQTAQKTYELLENLLEWSRTQSDLTPFEPKRIRFPEMCYSVIDNLAAYAETKDISIKYASNAFVEFTADTKMLETVLRNLVINAIKFSNKYSHVNIYAEKETDQVTVTVSDNGVGMDSETAQKLFDLEQMKSRPGTHGEKGTGLGLIICKEFIEKHKGKIWVESESGKGSNFKFTIPLHIN